jgi:serine/threonine-protein kinase RsbW
MVSPCVETCWSGTAEDASPLNGWYLATASSVEEMSPLLETVAEAMTDLGYPPQDVFGMRLALEEALVNAIKHGHRLDPSKQVEVHYHVSPEQVLLDVEDQGEGFDPENVPDPTAAENLERPNGRGLLLIRAYTSWIRYSDRGNAVTLCKYPSTPIFPR